MPRGSIWPAFSLAMTELCLRLLQTAKIMSDTDKIDATMLKDLRSEVAALKSKATGGIIPPTGTTQGGDEPSQDAQLPHGSGTSDINAPPAKKRKENREESDEEAADSSNDEDNICTLSESGTVFMEAVFKGGRGFMKPYKWLTL